MPAGASGEPHVIVLDVLGEFVLAKTETAMQVHAESIIVQWDGCGHNLWRTHRCHGGVPSGRLLCADQGSGATG